MDATTLFLLRLSGPVLLIVGVAILMNGALYQKMIKELTGEFSVAYYLAGIIPLTIGVAMILVHNLWGSIPEVLVSLLGWGSLLKGCIRLLFPDMARKWLKSITKKMYLPPWAILVILWGGAMAWYGFM